MPTDLTKQYEAMLRKAIANAEKQIRKIYEQSILEISIKASTVSLKDQPFSINAYPALNRQIEAKVDDMHKKIYGQIVKSVEKSWALSNEKNDLIVDKRLAGKKPAAGVRQILYDPNKQAFDSFIKRKEKGLNLSERVWNSLDTFKKEMEQSLGLGMNKGQSATSLASELKQYLNNPDKLFRRVRNEEGKLVLSKAAREFHPGQGVYRSSYKNALRLTRTENNIAYRTADHTRWQNLPFVTGIEIKTSNNHPEFDICDTLKGKYPKEFKFTGWHPQCLCFQIPEMMPDAQYSKLEDEILGIGTFDPDLVKHIEQPPAAFAQYLKDNEKRIAGWKNKPYWLKDNPEIVQLAKKAAKGKADVDFSVLNLERYFSRVDTPKYANVFPELSLEEKASIYGYTGNEYYSLNSYLRGLKVTPDRATYFDNYRNLLNNALDEIGERYEGTAFRGTSLGLDDLKIYQEGHKSGLPVTHNYFTSTSKDISGQFSGNTRFIVYSKNGKYVEPLTSHPGEKEVLFKAGTKFKVLKYEKRSDGKTYITLEEVI